MSVSKKAKAVRVDGDVHDSLTAYSELTGVNINAVASKAIRDWMETVGAVHMEVWRKTKFQVTPENNVVAFPTSGPDLLEAVSLAAHVSARDVRVVPSPDVNVQAVLGGAHVNLTEGALNPGVPD